MNGLFKIMPQHLNWIYVQTLIWPLQNLNFVFLEPFRGGLAGLLGIIVLLHNPSALELEVTNWRPDILLQDFPIEGRIHGSINYGMSTSSWSCKAAPEHHTTTTMFDCCWYDVLFMKSCVGFTPDVTGNTFQKGQLLSRQSTEYLHKILGDNQDIIDKCETSLCVIFGQQWLLPWNSPMDAIFTQSLSHCWIMKFSPFVDNGSDCGSLEFQNLRNGFITLSRLIHVNYFVSHLFLNFFRSGLSLASEN